ncbi:ATP-binding cassette domain-containing protein [Brevibacterium sp. CBA3109]|uniref:ATP-binding cassette domain-containing protein n=1 Tax=Brevibacterium koreense TaxID=3140787 RepID=A0AAU7UQ74_9MICO
MHQCYHRTPVVHSVIPGQFTALIGSNGCGKSIVLRSLARLHPIASAMSASNPSARLFPQLHSLCRCCIASLTAGGRAAIDKALTLAGTLPCGLPAGLIVAILGAPTSCTCLRTHEHAGFCGVWRCKVRRLLARPQRYPS